MNIKYYLSFLISLWCFHAFSQESGGFVGGGGGTGIRVQDQYLLLDIWQFDPSYKINPSMKAVEPFVVEDYETTGVISVPIFDLNKSVVKTLSIPMFSDSAQQDLNQRLQKSSAFDLAKKRINRYGLVLSLPSAMLTNLKFYFTNAEPETQLRYYTIEKDIDVSTVAYYFFAKRSQSLVKRQVVISAPRWNKLDVTNQPALIVHEALRDYQQFISVGQKDKEFSEKILQQATAIITLCDHSLYLEDYLLRLLSAYNGSLGGEEGLGEGFNLSKAWNECKRKL
ncbi:MAG: hypothetical protein AB7I27_05270 [Bacteriovoracaceae bacterium]